MTFFNEPWFWAPFFTFIASLGAVLIKGWCDTRSQVNIERAVIVDLASRDNKGAKYCSPVHFGGAVVPSASERYPPGELVSTQCP